MRRLSVVFSLLLLFVFVTGLAAQQPAPTPEERFRRSWNGVMKKLVDMAEDFPEDKYTYKAHPDVRSFGEELMHVAFVNALVAARGRGEQVDRAALQEEYAYTSKADTAAKLKKSVEDVAAVVNGEDCLSLIGALEHAGEHYGKLVIYYRVNGLVPPATRAAQARQRQQQE